MIWLQQEFDFQSGAILNFNKPEGRTSFWLVKKVRNLVNTRAGHAGTLDPFATGVLLICTGKATRQIATLMDHPKEYIGEIELGSVTDTDDKTGKLIQRQEVPRLSLQDFKQICNSFVGDIYQLPPMFSARKVNGKRLYKIARMGKVIEREPKLVHIEDIDILSFNIPVAKIKLTCSKGTYIRALARDIGHRIGCGAHLKSLVRTRIGEYKITDSLTWNQFEQILKSA